ncbi:hypothetical protein [Gemmatimonas sp.]|uniref:hypothetical protein n=1 Tax=Gemmatimonas sp. TaxID=1962908 RepID=UPI003F70D3A9
MFFLQKLPSVFAKVFGIHSTSAAVLSSQPAASMTVEKSAVAVVGGGRRPARLRGKAVRIVCPWQVVEHDGGALFLRRSPLCQYE